MPTLPILKTSTAPASTETLVRLFHQLQANWTAHLAEQTLLDVGTAWTSAELPRVFDANRIFDVALPAEITAQAATEQVAEHYSSRGTTCWKWVMNPSAPAEQTTPMVDHLLASGYTKSVHDIMHLDRLPSSLPGGPPEGLTIIPARASFKHARALHEENAAAWNDPQLVEAEMTHLDDPHYDALIALRDGTAAALIGVLAMGEVGMIEQVYVAAAFRGKGLATTMMGRAIEICARSLFKHVMLQVSPQNATAIALHQKFGFRKIGELVEFLKPG